MYSAHGPMSGSTLDIFGFIPEELIHNTGIMVMVVIFAAGLLGLATMARRVSRDRGVTLRSMFGSRAALSKAARRCLGRDRRRHARPAPLSR